MIELFYSNKTECLLQELSKGIRDHRSDGERKLEPVELVVPNRNMETYVRLGLAQSLGVAANLRFNFLNSFFGDIVFKASQGKMRLADLDTLEAAVLAALMDDALLNKTEMQPVRIYLESSVGAGSTGPDVCPGDAYLLKDGVDLRRVQLAARVAFLFQEYIFSRPEMVAAWRDDGSIKPADLAVMPYTDPAAMNPDAALTVAWQRSLWRAVFGSGGILEQNPPAENGRWITMDYLAFDNKLFENIKNYGLPPLHIFGVSYMARLYQHIFAGLGRIATLNIYSLNPCAEFWEDVETDREFSRRLNRELIRREKRLWNGTGETHDEDPFGLFDADTPALRYWGRPGREHMRLLGELTDCDFTAAFEDPCGENGGLLHLLQRDILLREPEQSLEKDADGAEAAIKNPDDTIKLVAAPSVRREVEWVADEIWRLMRQSEGSSLRFSDVAIIVNSKSQDVYLPHIEAVFSASHGLPCSISDVPAKAGSRLIEAMGLLLKLPFSRFSRAEMLSFLGHPAVIGCFDDFKPDDLTGLIDALGIVFGADSSDHAGTYIDEDVYNWDQGIRRLVLGAFMTGEKSGDRRIFETAGGRWLAEESPGTDAMTAARFGLLVRSLLADARFVRRQQMTLTDWAGFYRAQAEAYFSAEKVEDERDRLRLLHALGRLEKMDLGKKVSGRVASEIAASTIESLEGGHGHYLTEGVVVSSFLPMRAIPFKVVFVLGLGEGLFPASARKDALDLRAVRRRAGDVDPPERDRYMFLETLLCTRERLYLSYVSRNEFTGDPLQPSAVLQELLYIMKKGYVGEEGMKSLFIEPPLQLRRYDEPFHQRDTFIHEALVESRVQDIAADWKRRVYRAGDLSEELDLIRHVVSPENREALFRLLAIPADPAASLPVKATPRFGDSTGEKMAETPVFISISVLRNFLGCAMQGWASALLGLEQEEADLEYQEEEDFEIGRLAETTLLKDVFPDALTHGYSPEKIYRERAERLRLAGKFPAGILGRFAEKRHLAIMDGWLSLLKQQNDEADACSDTQNESPQTCRGTPRGCPQQSSPAPGDDPQTCRGTPRGCPQRESEAPENYPALQRIRIGHSWQQGSAELVTDPLVLEVPLKDGQDQGRVVPVRIGGLTEAVSPDRRVTYIFLPKKPPGKKDRNTLANIFRYLLRGAVSHAALSALGAAGNGERQIIILYSDGVNSGGYKVRLQPTEAGSARSWLTNIAADLLGEPHAYLLPCEAAYLEYHDRKDDETAVNGDNLCSLVKKMAANEWSSFTSLWGPVQAPRSYEPPPAQEAERIFNRRFEPLLGDIISLEVF